MHFNHGLQFIETQSEFVFASKNPQRTFKRFIERYRENNP